MNCEIARETLSALLDDEAPPRTTGVNAHVADCDDCRSWQEAAHLLTRRVRLTSARPIADGTARILEAVIADRPARRSGRGRQLIRAGLAVAALAQFAIVVPALVLGQAGMLGPAGIGIPVQAARELGAFNLALAVGFAVTALRPEHARGMRPLVGAATVCLIALAVIDTAMGKTTLLAEVPHLIALVGLVLLHLIVERESSTDKRWRMPLTITWNRSAARLARSNATTAPAAAGLPATVADTSSAGRSRLD